MRRIHVTLFSVLLGCSALIAVHDPAQAQVAAAPAPRALAAPCVPSPAVPASYTDWADSGAVIQTEEDAAPAADTDTVRYVAAGATAPEVITPAQEAAWWNFAPTDAQGPFQGTPTFPTDPAGTWQGPHTEGGPGPDEVGVFQVGNGNGDWFYRQPATAEVTDVDYLWQMQVRELVPAKDAVVCDEVGGVIEHNPGDEVGGVAAQTEIEHQFRCGEAIRIERTKVNGRVVGVTRSVRPTGEKCTAAQRRIAPAAWVRSHVKETGL